MASLIGFYIFGYPNPYLMALGVGLATVAIATALLITRSNKLAKWGVATYFAMLLGFLAWVRISA